MESEENGALTDRCMHWRESREEKRRKNINPGVWKTKKDEKLSSFIQWAKAFFPSSVKNLEHFFFLKLKGKKNWCLFNLYLLLEVYVRNDFLQPCYYWLITSRKHKHYSVDIVYYSRLKLPYPIILIIIVNPAYRFFKKKKKKFTFFVSFLTNCYYNRKGN